MGALKFRVLLDSEKNQEIFRDIQINEDENFETFYRVILNSFRFEGQEMGSFYISNDDWDKGHEIGLLDMRYSDEDEGLTSVMKEAKISDFIAAPDQKIILVYDFLRMWIFLIELIEKHPDSIAQPTVSLSVGIAPPEDSRQIQDEAFLLEEEAELEDDLDEEDYEDGYNDEDLSSYEEYDY